MLVYYWRLGGARWQPFLQICDPDDLSLTAILYSLALTFPGLRLACKWPGDEFFTEPVAVGTDLMARNVPLEDYTGLPVPE